MPIMKRTLLYPHYYDIPRDWEVLYRATSRGDRILFQEFTIIKYTACGVWFSNYGVEKFVNLRATKQYASMTKQEAVAQLWHRKVRHIHIIRRQLLEAHDTVRLIKLEWPGTI